MAYNDEDHLERQTNLSIASQSIIITNKVLNRAGEQNYQAIQGIYTNNDDAAYSTNTMTLMNQVN